MTAFHGGKVREGWGVFDDAGFRLENSPYKAIDKVPFTICDLAGSAIAIVVERPHSAELHARLAAAARPPWLDAIGQATLVSAPDAEVAVVDSDLVAPADFDRRALAVASAIVLFSHGMLEREPDSYEVRVGGETFRFAMTFDDDTESWSAG